MTNKKTLSKLLQIVVISTPIILIAAFLLFPVITVLVSAFLDQEGFTLSYLGETFSNGCYYKLFAFTLSQALLSTLMSVIIGLPIGYIFGRYQFRGRNILLTFFTVPFVLPVTIVGFGFITIFGENGIFGSPFLSIILAHAFYNIPLVIQYFSAYYQTFDKNLIDASRSLGGKTMQTIFRIYLPIFLQPILSAALLTFNFCFLSFGIVYILGQAKFRTVETQIFAEFSKGYLNNAYALALMQLMVTITYILLYLLVLRARSDKKKTVTTTLNPRVRLSTIRLKNNRQRLTFSIFLCVFLFGLFLELAPLISIISTSFWDQGLQNISFQNYQRLFSYADVPILRALGNSLLFAIGGTLFAAFLAILTVVTLRTKRKAAFGVIYEMLSYLPLTLSAITLSLGIRQTFINSAFFSDNPWIYIIITHGFLGYPFITRALLNGLQNIDSEILEAAKTLGASRWYRFRKIYLPLLLPSLFAGIAFSFGLSIGEFSTAKFFYLKNPSVLTLPVAMDKLRDLRRFGASNAAGVVLLLLSYASFFLIELFGAREKTLKKEQATFMKANRHSEGKKNEGLELL